MAQSLPDSTAFAAARSSSRELARVVIGMADMGIAALNSSGWVAARNHAPCPPMLKPVTSVRALLMSTSFFTCPTTASTASSLAGCAQLASGASGATITALRFSSAGNTSCPT